jgi:hypothetical protein
MSRESPKAAANQLAWIDNGVVFNETKQECMLVRDGELYSLDGERLGLHLRSLGVSGEETPPAFLRLLGIDQRHRWQSAGVSGGTASRSQLCCCPATVTSNVEQNH